MRHRRVGRVLKRSMGKRRALIRSLARSAILYKKIVTTEAKAKEIRPFIEKLVSRGKRGTHADQRFIAGTIGREAAKKLKNEIIPLVYERKGGYMRITKLDTRRGDMGNLAEISFIDKNI